MGSNFYNNKPLLDTLDSDGLKPAVFIVCSRVRGPGKTFSFVKLLIDVFIKSGFKDKFSLLTRNQTDVGYVCDGMFKPVMDHDHHGEWTVIEISRMGGVYGDVYIERVIDVTDEGKEVKERIHAGYVLAIRAHNRIKTQSGRFTDAVHTYFDEFQPQDPKDYVDSPAKEVKYVEDIMRSISRGRGSSYRYVPLYMSSNTLSVANPYFNAFGLSDKIQPNTKKVRVPGVVFELARNEGLVKIHAESALSRAFSSLKTVDYSDNSWINDSNTGVMKPDGWGESDYICTIIIEELKYSLRWYPEVEYAYLSRSVDETHPSVFRVSRDDDSNSAMLRGTTVGNYVNHYMRTGRMRFQNLQCKIMAVKELI